VCPEEGRIRGSASPSLDWASVGSLYKTFYTVDRDLLTAETADKNIPKKCLYSRNVDVDY